METKKNKIVCIVNNDVNDSKGLYNAFGNSFNSNSFVRKHLYSENNKIIGNNENKYLLISESNGAKLKQQISAKDPWDIIFTMDDLYTDINNYPKCLFTPETLVMYHTKPENTSTTLLEMQSSKKIKKCKEGMHIYSMEKGYTRLTKLLESNIWDDDCKKIVDKTKYYNAIKFITEWFGLNEKLNVALEFLHQSLGGIVNESILTKGEEKFDLTKTYKDETLQKWIDGLKVKTGNNYYEALRDVRDGLLLEAGVIN